jgi:hypothetical protein
VLKEALAMSRIPLLVVHPIVSPVNHDTEGRAPDHLTTEQTKPTVTTLSGSAVLDFVRDARSVVVRPAQGLLFRSLRPSLATLHAGSVVLMHENRGQTIRALHRLLLPWLLRHGYRLVSVPELLAFDPPKAAQLRAGWRGCQES